MGIQQMGILFAPHKKWLLESVLLVKMQTNHFGFD
jgi:hypothetical protein